MKPGKPLMQPPRLLDRVRERIRSLHYSHSTEKTYLYWVRFCPLACFKYPRDMRAIEVEALDHAGECSQSLGINGDHALSALVFLYREVLDIDFVSATIIYTYVFKYRPAARVGRWTLFGGKPS